MIKHLWLFPLPVAAVYLVFLFTFGVSIPAGAADSASKPAEIVSLASIPFGANAEILIQRFGEPDYDRTTQYRSVTQRRLVYLDETILGEDARINFYLHSTKGFLRGVYRISLKGAMEARRCETIYERFQDAISSKYPNLPPFEQKFNLSLVHEFCKACQIGKGGWLTAWKNETSGGKIGLFLLPTRDYLELSYESPEYGKWAAALEKAEREERF